MSPVDLEIARLSYFEKVRFLKVLMSATGTRPKSVKLYGAGAQT